MKTLAAFAFTLLSLMPPRPVCGSGEQPIASTRAAWTFDRANDLEGWRPNTHLTAVAVTDRLLHCRAVGSDPILELTAPFALEASPWQYLEVRMRATRDGTCEWFWSNTDQGRYGGFAQEKSVRFQVTGDGDWGAF